VTLLIFILANDPLLRVVKLESVCNQLLCYCQYITDREDIVLFLDPNNEQSKSLAINDEIRVSGESRYAFFRNIFYIFLPIDLI
jgi:hypothetical protein